MSMSKKNLKVVADTYRDGALDGRFQIDHLDLCAVKTLPRTPMPLVRMDGNTEVWRIEFNHDYSGPPYATFHQATGDLEALKADLAYLANRKAQANIRIITKRFLFEFYYEEQPETVYTFTLTGPGKMFLAEDFDEHHLPFCEQMEDYGVHDFGTTSNDEFIGFGSYEISLTDQPIVVEKWREHFVKMGYVVGDTEIMSRAEYEAKSA
jgi:hypothetical protein